MQISLLPDSSIPDFLQDYRPVALHLLLHLLPRGLEGLLVLLKLLVGLLDPDAVLLDLVKHSVLCDQLVHAALQLVLLGLQLDLQSGPRDEVRGDQTKESSHL